MAAQEDPAFLVLVRLHLLISWRYIKKLHKELAAMIVVAEVVDILGANNIERSFPQFLFVLYLVLAVTLQLYRKDKRFLRMALMHYQRFLFYENLALASPFAIVVAGYQEYLLLVVMIGVASVLAFLDPQLVRCQSPMQIVTKRFARLFGVLPRNAFEWIAGVRKSAPGLLVIYALAALGFLSGAFDILAMILLAITVSSFYETCESYLMIEGTATRETFFRTKLLQAVGLYLTFASPAIAVALINMRVVHWWVIIVVIALSLIYITGAVLVKYAHFDQGRIKGTQQSIRLILIGASLPLFPITLLYEWHLLKKAKKQLPIFLQRSHS